MVILKLFIIRNNSFRSNVVECRFVKVLNSTRKELVLIPELYQSNVEFPAMTVSLLNDELLMVIMLEGRSIVIKFALFVAELLSNDELLMVTVP